MGRAGVGGESGDISVSKTSGGRRVRRREGSDGPEIGEVLLMSALAREASPTLFIVPMVPCSVSAGGYGWIGTNA